MAYTPTVYTNEASSPDLDATNLNKSEQGIKDAHLIAVPVDCSSRVAEYSGDGIPLIPDNVAGVTYLKRNDWTTVDGWGGQSTTVVSVESGKLKSVCMSSSNGTYHAMGTWDNKLIILRITCSIPITDVKWYNGTTSVNAIIQKLGTHSAIASFYCASGGYSNFILWVNQSQSIAQTWYIDTIYIGTGAYDTPAIDRAGNGNNLINTACTPVSGKYGKELLFNGTTSFLQASSPIIGTTGTIAIRFKNNVVGTDIKYFDNRSAHTNGIVLLKTNQNIVVLYASNGTTIVPAQIGTVSDTLYHTVVITMQGFIYLDGIQTVASPSIYVQGLTNLLIGKGYLNAEYFNGIISHFRYDSRIWTADEARAWSLNPISIDSRV